MKFVLMACLVLCIGCKSSTSTKHETQCSFPEKKCCDPVPAPAGPVNGCKCLHCMCSDGKSCLCTQKECDEVGCTCNQPNGKPCCKKD
jgi:hypothetical protein